MQKTLLAIGILFVLAGVFWPLFQKIGLFRLPGDIYIEWEEYRFFFPITSMVVISLLLTLFFWVIRK